jgi:hypothetical protein
LTNIAGDITDTAAAVVIGTTKEVMMLDWTKDQQRHLISRAQDLFKEIRRQKSKNKLNQH